MKRRIILLIAFLVLISFAACSAPTEEISEATPEPTAEITAEPTPEPIPTPEPEPTMSPEEKALNDEVESLTRYAKDYDDAYAWVLLNNMYCEGILTEEQVIETEIFIIGELQPEELEYFQVVSDLLSGVSRDYPEYTYQIFNELTSSVGNSGSGYQLISLFQSQEERDWVEESIAIANNWVKDPTSENTELFENRMLNSEATYGQKNYVSAYISCRIPRKIISEGQEYTSDEYFNERIFDKENNLNFADYNFYIGEINQMIIIEGKTEQEALKESGLVKSLASFSDNSR